MSTLSATIDRAPTGLARRLGPLPVILAGTFMVVLDFFVVNVALPSLQADLHASTPSAEWVVAGYGLTSAVFLITAARLGDRLGRRRTFSAGLVLFTLASLACGVAGTAEVLVAARLAQGVAAALLTPQVLSIIGATYEGEARVRAMAIYGVVVGVAAVGGQLIGGVLVEADLAGLGWRTCFLINVPIGAAALALAPRLVPESHGDRDGRLDLTGTVLVTLGLTAIVLPLVEGRQHGWPAWAWLSLAEAPLLLGAFVLHQRRLARRGGRPLLDLALFRDRAFTAGLVTQLALWCGQASFFLVLALELQRGHGLTPLASGAIFAILGAGYFATSAVAPGLALRHGRRVPAIGAVVLGLGHVLLATAAGELDGARSVATLVPGLVLVGAGMGLTITPLMGLVLATVEPVRAGAASGVLATMQQVGNALGVAVIGVVYFGALGGGADHAFALSTAVLAGVGAAVCALTRLLPTAAASSAPRRA